MIKESSAPLALPGRLPVWELEERVVFPFALSTVALALPEGKALLEASHANGDLMALFPVPRGARKPTTGVGVVALLLRMSPGSAGEGLVLLQGVVRAQLSVGRRRGAVRWASVKALPDLQEHSTKLTSAALRRSILERLDQLSGTPRGLASDVREFLGTVEDPGRLSDLVSAQLDVPFEKSVALLLEQDVVKRLNVLQAHLSTELEIQAIQERLERQTRDEMDKRQKEYFLRQQMEAIQAELSGGEENGNGEGGYKKRLAGLPILPEPRAVLEKEIAKIGRYGPFSEELSHIRAYLDLVFDLPWGLVTSDNLDLDAAQESLDKDHYGLKKVKDRILEYMAVSKMKGGNPGTLFCFVGPPGVGKTSLGRAIASTLGRKFVRMSLGGVRDEAEIRGHRRTYIGAMPGRIIQGVKNAGSLNPVFVLDEVDKMGSDWRGDPSSALLEALDSEQNKEFVDHYLGFPFDLSRVMFIATANTLESIHPAFMDRLEILELPGYTEEEKLAIARRHLLPKQIEANGLGKMEVEIKDEAILGIIRRYTREAGVRNLERGLEGLLRKLARKGASGEKGPFKVGPHNLQGLLGLPRFFEDMRLREDSPGVATGLAWTESGGEILFVEATATAGSGALTLTGQMGEVMRESAQAALTYIKEHMGDWGLDPKALAKRDIHIHVPEGSIPKDGPSAGITMAVALLSTLLGKPVPRKMAFTGEITLRGQVLPVGGLREKLLAAHRAGLKVAVLPEANRKEKQEFPSSVTRALKLVWVEDMGDVFKVALPNLGKARHPVKKKRLNPKGTRVAKKKR